MRDISERKRAETALELGQRRMNLVFDAADWSQILRGDGPPIRRSWPMACR